MNSNDTLLEAEQRIKDTEAAKMKIMATPGKMDNLVDQNNRGVLTSTAASIYAYNDRFC